jgi:hypothetical protein
VGQFEPLRWIITRAVGKHYALARLLAHDGAVASFLARVQGTSAARALIRHWRKYEQAATANQWNILQKS